MARDGLVADFDVRNISTLSLSEGILMWVNDSQSALKLPITGNWDNYNRLSFMVKNISAIASQDGNNQVQIPYFDSKGGMDFSKSSLYFDLNEVEKLLKINGNTSYTVSIGMILSFEVNLPSLQFHTITPSQLKDKKTFDFGFINVTCVNGERTFAHVDFPYQKLVYPVEIPYIQTLIPAGSTEISASDYEQ